MKIIDELSTFRSLMKNLLKLYSMDKHLVISNIITRREPAIESIDFLTPKIRDIGLFYIRKFCKNKTIQTDTIYKTVLRDIVTDIRKQIYFPLAKEYAKFIGTRQDKRKKDESDYG